MVRPICESTAKYHFNKPKLTVRPIHWCDLYASIYGGRYLEHVGRRNLTALNRSRLTKQTHLCNREISESNPLTVLKLLLNSLVIIGHCGWHLTKSYTMALNAPSRSFFYWCTSEWIQLLFSLKNLHHSLFFLLWLMLKCVESSWYQEGLTEPNMCHEWWCVSSRAVVAVQVIWFWP